SAREKFMAATSAKVRSPLITPPSPTGRRCGRPSPLPRAGSQSDRSTKQHCTMQWWYSSGSRDRAPPGPCAARHPRRYPLVLRPSGDVARTARPTPAPTGPPPPGAPSLPAVPPPSFHAVLRRRLGDRLGQPEKARLPRLRLGQRAHHRARRPLLFPPRGQRGQDHARDDLLRVLGAGLEGDGLAARPLPATLVLALGLLDRLAQRLGGPLLDQRLVQPLGLLPSLLEARDLLVVRVVEGQVAPRCRRHPLLADGRRRPRRSWPARYSARPALKETACGACGRVHRGIYDRTLRRVRNLSCGGLRIFVEIELR